MFIVKKSAESPHPATLRNLTETWRSRGATLVVKLVFDQNTKRPVAIHGVIISAASNPLAINNLGTHGV